VPKRGLRTTHKLVGLLVVAAVVLGGVLLLVRSSDPFEGRKLYVDPYSNAGRQAEEWRETHPADAAQMDKIAAQPTVYWFASRDEDVQRAVGDRVTTIVASEALPVLVAYNVPLRDCVGHFKIGAASPEAYGSWVRALAEGIGWRKVVVILEPDALALTDCLSEGDREARFTLIKDAVGVLKAKENIAVYIDAGHPNWVSAAEMAERLTEAGVAQADGFSLNVSGFKHTVSNLDYGKDLSSRIGGKHFVVDTSRNGLGPPPDGEWCNPPGRALGERPTSETDDPLADAYLWVKPPGESDGTCNGGPEAGQWWPEYALGLARRADY
jgi:endoglucanase